MRVSMDFLNQALTACYFLAIIASILKSFRYAADYRRKGEWFYLLGVPANVSLVLALGFILVAAGNDPKISGEWIKLGIRLSFMSWAIFGLLFEALYMATFVVIDTEEMREEREENESN